MVDLKIPKLNNKSNHYLFKNKFNIKEKSKSKLIKESITMSFFAIILLLINYLIPKKIDIFNSFTMNFKNIFESTLDILFYCYEIVLALFILISVLTSFILIIGAFNRLLKIFRYKKRKIFR